MKVIIDRFEGDYAVVETEDKIMVNMPKILLPNTKEGDIVRIETDEPETEKREQKIKDLFEKLAQH